MTARRPSVLGVLVSVATLGLLVGCHGSGQPEASADFTVDAPNALLDAPVAVSLHGVRPGAAVVITSRAVDGEQQAWTASATFTATAQGTVSLSQPATDGSYTGSNAMGLFEDMLPPASAPLDDNVFLPSGRSFPVSITAAVKGRTVASTTVQRNYPSVAEQHYRLADSGIYADLYSPKKTTVKHPAVLVFGGSEGGQDQNFTAELLAGEGYPAMALAYFKEPGLPSALEGINLEYFIKALSVLRVAPGVDPRHVLVYGISRGSEAALLLGVHFPNLVNGVIAGVPSSVTYGGYPHGSRPLWLLGGKALPYAPIADWNNPNPIDARAAVIPVEQIKGPVMMSCGVEDTEWTSCAYAAAIKSRLIQHQFRYPVISLRYPDAGHGAGQLARYYSATDAQFGSMGGDRRATLAAGADVYGRLLALLSSLTGH